MRREESVWNTILKKVSVVVSLEIKRNLMFQEQRLNALKYKIVQHDGTLLPPQLTKQGNSSTGSESSVKHSTCQLWLFFKDLSLGHQTLRWWKRGKKLLYLKHMAFGMPHSPKCGHAPAMPSLGPVTWLRVMFEEAWALDSQAKAKPAQRWHH